MKCTHMKLCHNKWPGKAILFYMNVVALHDDNHVEITSPVGYVSFAIFYLVTVIAY